MKAAFALNLSPDGIGLLRRTSRGWLSIGEVSLDAPDLADQLSYLRKTALALSPAGLGCKLVIPNDQILYTVVEAPGPDDEARRAQIARALEGMTPYPVPDLVFDWRGAGPSLQVAVVARETLAEAEAFAEDFRFAPLCFVAMPAADMFDGEPFFGLARNVAAHLPEGETLERDAGPVRIIGRGEPGPAPWPVPGPDQGAAPVSGAQARPAPGSPDAEFSGPDQGAAALPTAAGDTGAPPAPQPALQPAPQPAPPREPHPAPSAERPAAAAPPGRVAGKRRGKVPATPGATPVVAEPRPVPSMAELGGFTGLGARIAERRADVMASGRVLPLAAVAVVLVVALLLWAAVSALRDDGANEQAVLATPTAPAGPAIAPPAPLAPSLPGAADGAGAAPPAGEPDPAAAAMAPAPAVSFAPPAQPLAVAEAEATAPAAPAEDTAPTAVAPQAAATAPADTNPAVPSDPPPPATRAPQAAAQAIDPDLRYDLTGVWTRAPDGPPAPAADRADAGLAAARETPPAAPAAPADLAALTAPPGTAPGPVPNPPPYAPPPRRDAEGRIIPTPEGVVTAEGVTLIAGRPPLAAPPRPAGLVPAPPQAAAPGPTPGTGADPDATGTAGTGAEPVDAAAAAAAAAAATETGTETGAPAVPVQPAPADAIRPPPRPAALAPEDEARATEAAEPAQPDPAAIQPAGADPALAGVRPRPATDTVRRQAEALAAARDAAAAREAQLAAQLAAASPLAVTSSRRPAVRPRDFSDAIAAALALAVTPEPAPPATPPAASPAAAPPPDIPEDDGEPEVREAVPNIPTTAAVSREATVSRAIRLNEVNLIGVFGTPGARRALVRMPNGRFQRVEVGDRLDGGRVAAIGETELSYVKNGRTIVLSLPRG